MSETQRKTETWKPNDPLEALDHLSNPVMIADQDMVIRYVNKAATQMFQLIEADIRKDLLSQLSDDDEDDAKTPPQPDGA